MPDIDFHYFWTSARAFDNLLRWVAPYNQHGSSHSAPMSEASGISQQALAAGFKPSSATVCCIVREVGQALWTGLKDEFVAFSEGEQWEVIRRDFWELWSYPNCIGAIDGKHVRVRAPTNSGSSFYNYKGFFSFILMAACDARYKFRYFSPTRITSLQKVAAIFKLLPLVLWSCLACIIGYTATLPLMTSGGPAPLVHIAFRKLRPYQ